MNKLRLGTPRNIAAVMIIPVERIKISAHKMQKGFLLYGSKEITALVIHTPYSLWAFDLNGHELSMEKLIYDVPDLKDLLADYTKQYSVFKIKPDS